MKYSSIPITNNCIDHDGHHIISLIDGRDKYLFCDKCNNIIYNYSYIHIKDDINYIIEEGRALENTKDHKILKEGDLDIIHKAQFLLSKIHKKYIDYTIELNKPYITEE